MILRPTYLLAALLMGAAIGPASAQMRGMPPPSIGPGTANPSAIVAAELGLARLSREKGQWTAFRNLAEKDAVLFTPGAVNAQRWLKGRADPVQPITISPEKIFISCDGSYGMAVGTQRNPDGSSQLYASLWRQQRKGDYRWVMRFIATNANLPAEASSDPVPISATVATCPRGRSAWADGASRRDLERERRHPEPVRIGDPPPAVGAAHSADGSLRWTWSAQGSVRTIELFIRKADGEERVLQLSAPMAAS